MCSDCITSSTAATTDTEKKNVNGTHCSLHLPLHVQSYYVKLFSLKTNTVPLSQLQQIKKVKPLRSHYQLSLLSL